MVNEPLKSVIRHRPPQPTREVSTPLDTAGGAPGTMKDSTVASQVPASSLKIACSGPGLGSGGIPCGAAAGVEGLSCAVTRARRPRTSVQATASVASFFTADLLAPDEADSTSWPPPPGPCSPASPSG